MVTELSIEILEEIQSSYKTYGLYFTLNKALIGALVPVVSNQRLNLPSEGVLEISLTNIPQASILAESSVDLSSIKEEAHLIPIYESLTLRLSKSSDEISKKNDSSNVSFESGYIQILQRANERLERTVDFLQNEYNLALDRFEEHSKSLNSELSAANNKISLFESENASLKQEMGEKKNKLSVLEEKVSFYELFCRENESSILKEELQQMYSLMDNSENLTIESMIKKVSLLKLKLQEKKKRNIELEQEKAEMMASHAEQLKSQEEFIQTLTQELSVIAQENSQLRQDNLSFDSSSSEHKLPEHNVLKKANETYRSRNNTTYMSINNEKHNAEHTEILSVENSFKENLSTPLHCKNRARTPFSSNIEQSFELTNNRLTRHTASSQKKAMLSKPVLSGRNKSGHLRRKPFR